MNEFICVMCLLCCVLFFSIAFFGVIEEFTPSVTLLFSGLGFLFALLTYISWSTDLRSKLQNNEQTLNKDIISLAVPYFGNTECIDGKVKLVTFDKQFGKMSGAHVLDESGEIKRCQPSNEICYNGFAYTVNEKGFPIENVTDQESGHYKRCGAESELK